jgi:hypothetical protein
MLSDKELFKQIVKRYPDKKEELEKMFPELAEDLSVPFVGLGQIFKKKGNGYDYVIVIDRQKHELIMINITLGYTFQGRVHRHSNSRDILITLGDLKELSSGGHKCFYFNGKIKTSIGCTEE